MQRDDLFLRPDVPGFWPSKGFVDISLIWKDMVLDQVHSCKVGYHFLNPENHL